MITLFPKVLLRSVRTIILQIIILLCAFFFPLSRRFILAQFVKKYSKIGKSLFKNADHN